MLRRTSASSGWAPRRAPAPPAPTCMYIQYIYIVYIYIYNIYIYIYSVYIYIYIYIHILYTYMYIYIYIYIYTYISVAILAQAFPSSSVPALHLPPPRSWRSVTSACGGSWPAWWEPMLRSGRCTAARCTLWCTTWTSSSRSGGHIPSWMHPPASFAFGMMWPRRSISWGHGRTSPSRTGWSSTARPPLGRRKGAFARSTSRSRQWLKKSLASWTRPRCIRSPQRSARGLAIWQRRPQRSSGTWCSTWRSMASWNLGGLHRWSPRPQEEHEFLQQWADQDHAPGSDQEGGEARRVSHGPFWAPDLRRSPRPGRAGTSRLRTP